MTGSPRYVLLVGSPKGNGGTSHQLGAYLMEQVPGDGDQKAIHHLGKSIRNPDRWAQVLADVDMADTVILATPLYWDSLPSHVTHALELIASHRAASPPKKPQNLVVVVNCGFPEPWHNEVALRICRRFADEAGLAWGGGMNVGGGGAINERPLEQAGGVATRLRMSLDAAAQSIGRGEPISSERGGTMEQQLYPAWFAPTLGGLGWKRLARSQGNSGSLKARPYKPRP